MRTTLDIEPDVLAMAKSLAAAQGASIGAVLSQLARKGLQANLDTTPGSGGFPVFDVATTTPITSESVRTALEDER